jgi:hypothetical protein
MSPPVIRRYYYAAGSSKFDSELGLRVKDGSVSEGAKDLYADAALTKIEGTTHYKAKKIGNKLGVPIFHVEVIVTTVEGSFTYSYIRDNYQKITVKTQATSGIFTEGIVNREYKKEKGLIRVRELTYISKK